MRREVEFFKCNPTQNMTILVKTSHPKELHPLIAAKMMAYDSVYAEQVGFIEQAASNEAVATLSMAGGEFCGNACMALAALVASTQTIDEQGLTDIVLNASGTKELIKCHVRKKADQYDCQVTMPLPQKIEQKTIEYDGEQREIVIVRYHEFIHIVMELHEYNESMKKKAESFARLLAIAGGAKVIGILFYQASTKEMYPLIYVPQIDSMIWERGCGSGTASIGAYLAWKAKDEVQAKVKQPGGVMEVWATADNDKITGLSIKGSVGIVAEGKAFIDL
ncbi:diaminopimelate epimerase [Halalkalibacter hemicellulosilyticus]|uniref:Diaminopimelate epimerase homolog n=1 Tax=Halalkalibacter hemicellulosilyticusJCM 9152 TaxID=1236971 RepID=W4Q9Q1_9BACI|nr:diaminopimelate epimerase [Halalkalibacter hemicellulosilyticus]GAE28730.1 Diaminopimelate epimerase homolog [Halalkalibacter hemicellulosilyticusJCM 9152]